MRCCSIAMVMFAFAGVPVPSITVAWVNSNGGSAASNGAASVDSTSNVMRFMKMLADISIFPWMAGDLEDRARVQFHKKK